jgi:hypothetical protein
MSHKYNKPPLLAGRQMEFCFGFGFVFGLVLVQVPVLAIWLGVMVRVEIGLELGFGLSWIRIEEFELHFDSDWELEPVLHGRLMFSAYMSGGSSSTLDARGSNDRRTRSAYTAYLPRRRLFSIILY